MEGTTTTTTTLSSPMDALPEECVSHVISLTTPRDACILALASAGLHSAVDSDATWRQFLPPDCAAVLSRAVDGREVEYSSMKELFLKLSDRHVMIDDGRMSFGLDRASGAKCYMIAARALEIAHAETPSCWRWISHPDSRFAEAAELIEVCWLDIIGRVNSNILSPKTTYGAYLVYKLTDTSSGLGCPLGKIKQEASITYNKSVSRSSVCLQTFHERYARRRFRKWRVPHETVEFSTGGAVTPVDRKDGWKEVELGEVCVEGEEEDEDGGVVEMRLREVDGWHWKCGLIVQGIEIRPKKEMLCMD